MHRDTVCVSAILHDTAAAYSSDFSSSVFWQALNRSSSVRDVSDRIMASRDIYACFKLPDMFAISKLFAANSSSTYTLPFRHASQQTTDERYGGRRISPLLFRHVRQRRRRSMFSPQYPIHRHAHLPADMVQHHHTEDDSTGVTISVRHPCIAATANSSVSFSPTSSSCTAHLTNTRSMQSVQPCL